MEQPDLAARQFGSTAQHYLTSTVHSSGADLERLATWPRVAVAAHVLDLGCGAGHASFALARGGAQRVTAYDLSAPMLDVVAAQAAARGHAQIETRVGSAERLPFGDASMDLVVTRYSAHHWLDVRQAMREVNRILPPGGMLVVIDVIASESPLMDTVLQTLELLRDESHVRDYRASEWRTMFEVAGFSAPTTHQWKLPMAFEPWVKRINTASRRIAALHAVFDALPTEACEYFAVTDDHSFAIDAAWLETTKR